MERDRGPYAPQGSGHSRQVMMHTGLRKPSRSQLKLWGELHRAEARRQAGILLAEGFKVVSELLKSSAEVRAILILEEKKERWDGLFLSHLPEHIEIYNLTATQWRKLSQDKNPEGVMAVFALSPAGISDLPESGHALFAYRINNPNNLGALVRTAHWFGFGAVVVSAGSVDPGNPKVVRSSMGSIFHLPVISDVDFAAELPALRERYLLVASHAGEGIAPHPCSRNAGLILGSESHGLPELLADLASERWRIPGTGGAESLSLPQAAAIMMYECAKGTITH